MWACRIPSIYARYAGIAAQFPLCPMGHGTFFLIFKTWIVQCTHNTIFRTKNSSYFQALKIIFFTFLNWFLKIWKVFYYRQHSLDKRCNSLSSILVLFQYDINLCRIFTYRLSFAKLKSCRTTYFNWFLVLIIHWVKSEFKQKDFGILAADSTADHKIKAKWTPQAASNWVSWHWLWYSVIHKEWLLNLMMVMQRKKVKVI